MFVVGCGRTSTGVADRCRSPMWSTAGRLWHSCAVMRFTLWRTNAAELRRSCAQLRHRSENVPNCDADFSQSVVKMPQFMCSWFCSSIQRPMKRPLIHPIFSFHVQCSWQKAFILFITMHYFSLTHNLPFKKKIRKVKSLWRTSERNDDAQFTPMYKRFLRNQKRRQKAHLNIDRAVACLFLQFSIQCSTFREDHVVQPRPNLFHFIFVKMEFIENSI